MLRIPSWLLQSLKASLFSSYLVWGLSLKNPLDLISTFVKIGTILFFALTNSRTCWGSNEIRDDINSSISLCILRFRPKKVLNILFFGTFRRLLRQPIFWNNKKGTGRIAMGVERKMQFDIRIMLEQEPSSVKIIYLYSFDFLIRTVLKAYCHSCFPIFTILQVWE